MQAEQLQQLAQEAMQDHLAQNIGIQAFFRNNIQSQLKDAHEELENAAVQLHISHTNQSNHAIVQSHIEKATQHIQTLQSQIQDLLTNTNQDASMTQTDLYQKLSDREYQTLKMMAHGRTNGDIAEEMGVSPGTVTTYRRRIMQKLGVDDVASLLQIAFKSNLNHEEI